MKVSFFFFFFQAEDGIRDRTVTGVQTCALPISTCGRSAFSTGSVAGIRPATPSVERSGEVAQADSTPAPATLVDLFARSAGRHPGAVAVSDDAGQLTYAELAARSDRLAAGLTRLGVAAEDRVLLALPSSVDSVVALVGVAKAGAASLPVDPDIPGSEVDSALDAASVRLVLTGPDHDWPASRLRPTSEPGPQTVDW